jgi:hypothetical protein
MAGKYSGRFEPISSPISKNVILQKMKNSTWRVKMGRKAQQSLDLSHLNKALFAQSTTLLEIVYCHL